jgi:uncharacterized membrane protein YfcA
MIHEALATLHPARLWTPPGSDGRIVVPVGPGMILGGATGTALSDYLENKVLDYVLSVAAFTPAATLYVALFTAAPSDTGGGTEVTGGAYARIAVTNNATNFPAASGGSKSNGTDITFATATADWGTVTHVAVIDAAAAGNYYFWGALDTTRTVKNGDSFKFAATKLVFALD